LVLASVPVAPRTWDFRATLGRTNVNSTGRLRMQFGRPIEIVGAFVSVRPASSAGGGLVAPTPEDILVLLDTDNGDRFTNSEEEQGNALGQYALLASLSTEDFRRRLRIRMAWANPTLQAEFRWRRSPTGGPWFEDASIVCSLFVKFIKEDAERYGL
jgi:hypothetical protein